MQTLLEKDIAYYRKSQYEVEEMFLERWSPRSFKEQDVPEDVLYSVFEAARWAPSAMNLQPWRFIVARTEEDRERFHSFIMDANRIWCEKAPVLALIVSKKTNDTGEENRSHSFDAGAAWGYLTLQAHQNGLIVHGMGGFYKDEARKALNIPEDYEIHAVAAIGYQDEKEKLPEGFQEREFPSDRRPLSETVFEGEWAETERKADR